MTYSEDYSPAFRDILRIVGRGKKLQRDLTESEAEEAMRLILTGEVSEAQIGGFLVTMRVKEETVEEIRGFVKAARAVMQTMRPPNVDNLVDIALPYNGKTRTLQTGVAAALVLAASGTPVLLHGADHIPTKSGVAVLNLLRALGYPADMPADEVARTIEETNFGALNLANVLPQWTALTPIRHNFGVRTLMNTAEKLLNPANARRHISGFYHSSYLGRMAEALPGSDSQWMVQGEEGSIDIRPGKKTRLYRAENGGLTEIMIDAADYGFNEVVPLDTPPDPQTHADIIRRILAGEAHEAVPQIVLTAAVLMWMTGATPDIAAGLEIARDQLRSGRAFVVLNAHKPNSRSRRSSGGATP